jgi:hypothetical protein
MAACALAEGLKQNNKLEELDISRNDIGNEGAVAIAGALSPNHSIKNITLGVIGSPTVETEDAVLEAIQRNTTLEQCSLHGSFSAETKAKVEYLLSLNRGGRRILSSRSAVPLNYWPRILANSSDNADVLFFFLKEKHDTLIPRADARRIRTAPRKRKRSD